MGIAILKKLEPSELIAIIKATRSKRAVMRELGISENNSQAIKWLASFIQDYNVDVSHHSCGVPLSTRYDKDTISKWVSQSLCWTDLMKFMGIRFVGSNITTVKKLVKYYNISVDHFDPYKAAIINRSSTRSSHEDVFCENSCSHRATVKKTILRDNLLPYVCSKCNNDGKWNNEELVLHLEHKNGINNDNRIENLCFLCPNCHSQTSTYAGRNIRLTTTN